MNKVTMYKPVNEENVLYNILIPLCNNDDEISVLQCSRYFPLKMMNL